MSKLSYTDHIYEICITIFAIHQLVGSNQTVTKLYLSLSLKPNAHSNLTKSL